MPKGKTGRKAAKVASQIGCGHIYCPACDHKIKLTNIVSWYLRSLIENVMSTGKPVRLRGLATIYAKPGGVLGWRNDSLLASQLVAQSTEQQTQDTGHKTNGDELWKDSGRGVGEYSEGSL